MLIRRYTWPSFETNVNVRSNKMPGGKATFVTSYKENSAFRFSLDFPGARALDLLVSVPKGLQNDNGQIMVNLITSSPLPAVDSKARDTTTLKCHHHFKVSPSQELFLKLAVIPIEVFWFANNEVVNLFTPRLKTGATVNSGLFFRFLPQNSDYPKTQKLSKLRQIFPKTHVTKTQIFVISRNQIRLYFK